MCSEWGYYPRIIRIVLFCLFVFVLFLFCCFFSIFLKLKSLNNEIDFCCINFHWQKCLCYYLPLYEHQVGLVYLLSFFAQIVNVKLKRVLPPRRFFLSTRLWSVQQWGRRYLQLIGVKQKRNKTIFMMHGKSPRSEHILSI